MNPCPLLLPSWQDAAPCLLPTGSVLLVTLPDMVTLSTDLLSGPYGVTEVWSRNPGKVNCPHKDRAHDLDLTDQPFQLGELISMSQAARPRGEKYTEENKACI